MRPKIGAHVSVSGGLYKAIGNAKVIGAETIQIFGASPRKWQAQLPKAGDVEKYKKLLMESGIGPVYLHAPYLINLASADNDLWDKSVRNLSEHLAIAELLGADGLIFHIGSNNGDSAKDLAILRVVKGMKEVLSRVFGKAKLIIENSAGGGQKIGSTAAEIKLILEKVGSDRVKVCFDTAHAYEAGIINGYTPENIKNLFDEWDKEIGMEKIVVFHVNDSKTIFNSNDDKHENIGNGHIGIRGFASLAKERRLYDKSWILEVPGFQDSGPDKENIDILKGLF
jgi:deoxyribonuclease-4